MKYQSTRGGCQEQNLTFQQVLFSGYSSDGGLYVPSHVPCLTDLETWRSLTYPQILRHILRLYISREEIPDCDLDRICEKAFQHFENPDNVIPIKLLRNGLFVAELFHGPTLAFKDFAMAVVARLLQYFLQSRQERLTVLVGTSGDTGGAAIHALKEIPEIQLVVLYPDKRCSSVQELQMITVSRPNIHVFNVEGSSDDLDVPIKQLLLDEDFKKEFHLASINSINWGRIVVQLAHFVYVYLQCTEHQSETLNIIVPSGAAGNLAAGLLAKRMGVPINLLASLNDNDTLRLLIQDGKLSYGAIAVTTHASAMDIQVPYNVERLLYFTTLDTKTVSHYMCELEEKKSVKVPDDLKEKLQQLVNGAASFSDEIIIDTIKQCCKDENYQICPHTATAVAYYMQDRQKQMGNFVCLATASIAKFSAVSHAANIPEIPNAILASLASLPTYQHYLRRVPTDKSLNDSYQRWEQELRSYIRNIYA